jgi:hypothetical protein
MSLILRVWNQHPPTHNTHVRTPSERVSPVPSSVQHKIGHLNLRSLASRPPLLPYGFMVENVVRVRPSSASARGNRLVNSAKGPPSPTTFPNSRANPTCFQLEHQQFALTYLTSGIRVIAQMIAEIPPITSSSGGASPEDGQMPLSTYRGEVPALQPKHDEEDSPMSE